MQLHQIAAVHTNNKRPWFTIAVKIHHREIYKKKSAASVAFE